MIKELHSSKHHGAFNNKLQECITHLSETPFEGIKGKYFLTQRYHGISEYELTGGHRLFLLIDQEKDSVYIYHVGKHPNKGKLPEPPNIGNIKWDKAVKMM